MNSGSASSHAPPSLAARGFTRRCKKLQAAGGSGAASSFFLSSPAVKITVTCNQKRTHRQSVLVNFFRSVFLCFPSLSASLFSFSGLILGLRHLLLCFGWQIGRRCSVQRATVDLWRRCCLTVWTALMARWACCWMVFTPVGGSGL